jgi:hypothetical protein
MSWAQIIAAIKMGLVASAESVANIISGVTKVGNADKLDGYDAADFLLSNGTLKNFNVVTDLDSFCTGIGLFSESTTNKPGDTWWLVISGGDHNTRTQVAFSLFNSVGVKIRYCSGGVWSVWNNLNTDCLPLSGGTVSANTSPLTINATGTTYSLIPFQSKGVALGYLGLSAANTPVYAGTDGVPLVLLHTGNYKKLITELNANVADERAIATVPDDYNNAFKIRGIKTNDVIGITGTNFTYSTVLGVRGWSDSSGGNAHEFALHGGGEIYHRYGDSKVWNVWRKLLHTGNSVPVVVSTTAPTDTTAVWIIPS